MSAAGRGGDTAGGPARHVPVMLPDVLKALAPCRGGTYVDGTFGSGGYSEAILRAADCRVIALDRDGQAVAAGRALAEAFAPRLTLVEARFGDMEEVLARERAGPVDGVVLDIGVSSVQLGDPSRGFSFQLDGPLDMRMGGEGPTAADVVNKLAEASLASVIRVYGEEARARAVARGIAAARARRPFGTTGELAEVVRRAVGGGARARIDPATKTFQAIRILVNDELGELARSLEAAERVLKGGGRLAVVSFHSLEDRIVKRFIAERTGRAGAVSRHRPEPERREPTFRAVGRAAKPDAHEIETNPRARSARLRVAERTGAAAAPVSPAALGVPDLLGVMEGL